MTAKTYLSTLRSIEKHDGRPGQYEAEALRILALRQWIERRPGANGMVWFLTAKGREVVHGRRVPTPHPCEGRAPNVKRVFEAIADGRPCSPGAFPRALAALEGLGLVEPAGNGFRLPAAVRAQWERWCAENREATVAKP